MFEKKEIAVIIVLNQKMRFCLYLALGLGVLHADSKSVPPARVALAHPRVSQVVRADPRSGQLIRTVVVAPKIIESRLIPSQPLEDAAVPVSSPSGSAQVRDLVQDTAAAYEVSPALVESVISVESNYNPNAISPKGAQGLMQLMPATARRFGVKNSFDPKQNIEGGVRYLKFLQETFKDERLAIAAYNAGEGAVQKYGNVPPYAETVSYVAKVGKKYGQARRTADAAKKAAQQAKAEALPKPPEYRRLAQFIDSDGKIYLTTQ